MKVYLNNRDEPRIMWNVNNPKTIHAVTNHLESMSFSDNFTAYNQTLHGMCHFPSKLRPWISLEDHHGIFVKPVTVDYTTDLLPVLSWVTYGKCFADIRVPNPDYYHKYAQFISIFIDSF